jgi:hypothetical protein
LHKVKITPQLFDQDVAVLYRLLNFPVWKFKQSEYLWFLASIDLNQEVSLRLRVIPSFKEYLIGHFKLIIGLLTNPFQALHESQKSLF